MWYIFKADKCIATCDFEPNQEDLESRNEKAYESTEYIPLTEAILSGDNVVKTESLPQVVTPPINQDIADLYQAMLEMSAELEILKGGK